MSSFQPRASSMDATAPATRLAALLATACALLLGLLAAVSLLALHLHFEARDRALLHTHLQAARALLVGMDNTAALTALPARFEAAFADEPALAVRVQGAYGQPLYEQGPAAGLPPALLTRPSVSAQPAPLVTWRGGDGRTWRGSALAMRLPLEGASTLTVAMALDIEPHESFMASFRWTLIGYVLLAVAAFALLARWAAGRALARSARPGAIASTPIGVNEPALDPHR
ncbi:hypothetical protein [Ottowia testudinis]|uniref:CusS-like sensor domain-containing protein n=1 Tax=Ottowia testudinis TaxID=2816950 RepID=A0A975CG12_9BURK|nr:hypothetical protein [Ottowia testudinis]QTD45117.1 hypothetical protein J1M35_19170 [Ottowia testudinis]